MKGPTRAPSLASSLLVMWRSNGAFADTARQLQACQSRIAALRQWIGSFSDRSTRDRWMAEVDAIENMLQPSLQAARERQALLDRAWAGIIDALAQR